MALIENWVCVPANWIITNKCSPPPQNPKHIHQWHFIPWRFVRGVKTGYREVPNWFWRIDANTCNRTDVQINYPTFGRLDTLLVLVLACIMLYLAAFLGIHLATSTGVSIEPWEIWSPCKSFVLMIVLSPCYAFGSCWLLLSIHWTNSLNKVCFILLLGLPSVVFGLRFGSTSTCDEVS